MEAYFELLVRFVVCLAALVAGIVVMVRADDNAAARRLTAAVAALVLIFNERIGFYAYLIFGSLLETLLVSTSITFAFFFVSAILLVVVTFPVVAVVRWVIR